MSPKAEPVPLQRLLLWGLLTAVLLAVVVTAVMAPRWSALAVRQPPPVLGQVPPFELINRDGRTISNEELEGASWVANFIFTRCALSCPRMTSRMLQLGTLLSPEARVMRVSFSVDPDHDTPDVLQQYASSWQIDDPRWLFLTGDRAALYPLITEGFHLAVDAGPAAAAANPEEPIVHSTRFVLVDREGAIRGYYDVARGEELTRLLQDLAALPTPG